MSGNQDQRASESVDPIDQVADLLMGDLDSSTLQDEGNDESQTESSTDEEVDANDQETQDTEEADETADSDLTWAKALGVDDDDIVLDAEGNFQGVRTKIDGVESVVTLKEAISGFQFNKVVTQKSQALAEERRQFDELKTAVTQDYTKRIENAAKLTELLANKFLEDYNSIDWQRLRQDNPGQYAALQQDMQAKRAELEAVFTAIESEKAEQQKQVSVEQQQNWAKHLQKQAEIAINDNPDWRDINKFKTAMTEMQTFISETYGFTSEEFTSVYDARLLRLIKDAQAYRKGAKQITENIVKKAPKFQQGSGQVKKVSKLDQLVKTAKTTKGYHKRAAETDAVTALLLGGFK